MSFTNQTMLYQVWYAKDRCDMSSLEGVLFAFTIGFADITIRNEIMDQGAPEQRNFGRETMVYECKKIDLKLLGYPCTIVCGKIGKLMKNGGI